jgi:serine/threonine-protein kinase
LPTANVVRPDSSEHCLPSSDLRDQLQATLSGSYTLERELGGGGMSRVFVAEELRLKRKVVVKVLSPELAQGISVERFEREIQTVAALQHANIVPVLTAGDSNGLPFYTMPFVDGESLRARLGSGPFPVAEVIGILRDVSKALAYAHQRGVVHRDIKPDNVLISGGVAVVTDFGIAKAISAARTSSGGATLTQIGTSIGTPAYMAPEQAAGDPDIDHRADIYSLGAMAYELLTGHPPFANKLPHQLFLAHASQTPAPIEPQRPDCPKPLAALVMRCLEKDADRRPQNAREVQQALDAVATPPVGSALSPAKQRTVLLGAAAAVVLLAALVFVALNRTRASASDNRSVAVLPFENAGGDTANAYFAEGIAEELITALSKVPGLRVAGRSSSFRFRGKGSDTRDIARTLNVASLLEGSVRRSGSRMRVTAQLTNAPDGVVLWSESYEREIKDAFTVQDEITRAIVGALQVRLAPGAAAAPAAAPAREVDPDAYDSYLRGLAYFRQRGKYVQMSIGYFEQAIAKDSMFARAYAQLSMALAMLPVYSPVAYDSLRTRTFAVAERAIALDSSSGEAHAALATAYGFSTSEYPKSLAEFERAIALDPNNSPSRYLLSTVLGATGDYDRSVAEARRAVELDPVAPVARFVLSKDELLARLYEDAAANARRAVQLDSLYPLAPSTLAAAEYFLGHRDVARQVALRSVPLPASGPYLAFVLSATGDAASRAALLRTLEAKRPTDSQRETSLAAAYLGAGDSSRAFVALERAAARKEPLSASMGLGSPVYDPIRGSARFTAILRAYGLDPALVNAAAARRVK